MKFFTNKKFLFKLIVSICLCLTIWNFGVTPTVEAGWLFNTAESAVEGGGKLIGPIVDLLLTLGDAIIDIIQNAIMGTESAITINTARKVIFAVIAGIVALVLVGLAVAIAGPLVAALGPILATVIGGAAGVAKIALAGFIFSAAYTGLSGAFLPDITLVPLYSISPEEIFSGEILLFDVNIFNPKELYVKVYKEDVDEEGVNLKATEWNATTTDSDGNEIISNEKRKNGYEVRYYYYYKDGNSGNNSEDNMIITSANNSAYDLKKVVSKWYYTIRNIAMVALMIILVYVGIRMLLTSVAAEKAKYKQMLIDWLVAMCLVFLMQYIMVFANNFTDSITQLLSSVVEKNKYVVKIDDAESALIEAFEDQGLGDYVSNGDIVWPTNLMGQARMMAQEQNGTTGYVGYAMCYLVLVIYTVIFTITYAKRLLYIVFFTIISPLVAVSYPLDKINDGKSQAFDIWLKEYIFNLLIQPFHLLLYVVLISMAFDLAGTNIIYSLVAIGFMIPAEKFLRKMFGFDKASTPGFLEGATGTALAMHGLQSLGKLAGKGPGPHKGKISEKDNDGRINFLDRGADSGNSIDSLITGRDDLPPGGDDDDPLPEDRDDTPPGGDDDDPLPGDRDDTPPGGDDDPLPGDRDDTQPGEEDDALPPEGDDDEEPTQIDDMSRIQKIGRYANARWKNYTRKVRSGYTKDALIRNGLRGAGETAQTAVKLSAGIAGGIVGASAGIASGDLKSVSQNAITGAYAGNAIGTGVTNFAVNKFEQEKRQQEETIKEMYGDQYSTHMKNKKDDLFKNDAEMRALYARELGLNEKYKGINREQRKARKEAIDKAMADAIKYRKNGVTDNDIIIKAMTMNGGNEHNRTNSERIAAARLAPITKSEKDIESNMKRFKEKGVNTDKINRIENYIRTINKIK